MRMPLRRPELIGPRTKNREFFSGHLRRKLKHKEWLSKNKERVIESKRSWAKNNPRRIRHYGLRDNYGVTLEEYERIWKSQGYLCAVCRRPRLSTEKAFCLDHNHETKENRGILCQQCNTGLGYFKESTDSLRHALEYLEKWK